MTGVTEAGGEGSCIGLLLLHALAVGVDPEVDARRPALAGTDVGVAAGEVLLGGATDGAVAAKDDPSEPAHPGWDVPLVHDGRRVIEGVAATDHGHGRRHLRIARRHTGGVGRVERVEHDVHLLVHGLVLLLLHEGGATGAPPMVLDHAIREPERLAALAALGHLLAPCWPGC